ncbi:PqqD family protein [Desulfoferrobacter suflitae]|uniref:PqqD family protein n=1 Tax=Desulfoferrobacter suflitae TaxID=2865782 RepID=UPI0021640CEA|nr:PqqD family protein [Desulfoferrobacter suflitae]MCK8602747.1 PqqD family protein [Desulfoferrobacter suflitae]
MLEKIIRLNDNIIWRTIEGEAVLLNQATGDYYGLNSVGCSFWEKIDGSRTVAEIIQLLMREYDVPEAAVTRDVLELIAEMQRQGLLYVR